jgi:glycosyltransferase involved in cell wall biosynthesis
MPTAIPSEIRHLASVAEKFAALRETADFMQHHSSFKAAHDILQQETEPRRRQECLSYIERNLPREGLGRILGLSFMASAAQDAAYLRELQETLMRPPYTLQQRHFFYWQLLTRHSRIRGEPPMDPAAVYFSLLDSYRRCLRINASWIEPASRAPDTIVVITNQLLGIQHAPTADCLDYCHILQASLKKKVYLINTGDMPWMLPMPYYDPVVFGHAHEYSAARKLPFRGETIDFYQCRKPMPNLEEIDLILQSILSLKPSFILNLGHSNVTADLCAEFITVATMPFGTDLPRAASNLFLLPRKRKPSDAAFMEQWRISEEQIVETQYTFRLPDRSETLTRKELGLPEDAYVLAVVGNRLDEEVDAAFAEEMSELLRHLPSAFIAFLGQFSRFSAVTRKYPVLENRSAFLGHRKDILAAYECCNAYWNPPRYGGGSSAAFALALGLPVFTGPTGDVASIAGPDFLFPAWHTIKDHIEKSLADPAHRSHWEEVAKMRFREISDRKGMLEGILAKVAEKAAIRKASR